MIDQPLETSENTSTDGILGGRVFITQPADGYRTAIDPILLAAACPATAQEHVLDAGCGVGAASLCLTARTGCRVTGIEIQALRTEQARQNAVRNHVEDRFHVMEGSILSPPALLREIRFDHVIVNPPYLTENFGTGEPSLASHESDAKLNDWVEFSLPRIKHGGSMVFVHRADRLDELLTLFSGRVGAIVILPLWRKSGDEARRIIIGGIKGRKTPLRLLPGIDLHTHEGTFTPQAEAILRDAQPLPLW